MIPPACGAGNCLRPTVGNHWHPIRHRQDAGPGVPTLEGSSFLWEHRAFFQALLCSNTPVPFFSGLCLLISKVGPWIKSLVSSSITRFTSRFQTVSLLVHEMLLFFPRERRWSNRKPSKLVSIYATFLSNFFLKMRFFPYTPHPPYRGKAKEEKWRNPLSFLPSQALSF